MTNSTLNTEPTSKIISVHSFRGGTGKSNVSLNLAALLVARGYRVGVVDSDIPSPGAHVLLGFLPDQLPYTLSQFLLGKCQIEQIFYDATRRAVFGEQQTNPGQLWFCPASPREADIVEVVRGGYTVNRFSEVFEYMAKQLRCQYIIIDTHPGVAEESVFALMVSDVALITLRPDQQDLFGTAVAISLAEQFNVQQTWLVVNNASERLAEQEIRFRVQQRLARQVAAVLYFDADLHAWGSEGLFSLRYPDHDWTLRLEQLAERLIQLPEL
jgi:MinD-like ATPase involved in chromosome partitioning or flagellar assembly